MKTEYLITFDAKDNLCIDVEKFRHLLMAHSSISFGNKSIIKYSGKEFPFTLATGILTDGSIYYDLTLECPENGQLCEFTDLLKEVRKICTKSSGRNIIVLYDGLGEMYCQLGYPVIYKIENIMRKLIYKFMAISIGMDWVETSIPKEVSDSIRTDGRKEKSSLLSEVDFIQLSNFLFKKYTKNDANKFFDSVKGMKDDDSIKVIDLKQYVPMTNWEKYFSKLDICDSEYLRTKWERLYDYRCKVAHCRVLLKHEYDELIVISSDVSGKIQSALDSINDIHIPPEEREDLAENISSAANKKVAEFIGEYNKLSTILELVCSITSGVDDIYGRHESNKTNVLMQSRYLCNNKGLISHDIVLMIEDARKFRNKLVHQFGLVEVNESELSENSQRIEMIINTLLGKSTKELVEYVGFDLRKRQDDDVKSDEGG